MKKLFILAMAVMPLLAISNYPEAKADDEAKVRTNIKSCFGVYADEVTADMYFDKDSYSGRRCKKVRNHHRRMPSHEHTLYDRIKNDSRFPNH
jgi:hypothetical protein